MRGSEPLAVGTPLRLELEGPGLDTPLRLDALVVHGREFDNLDGPAGFGVEFQSVEADEHTRLLQLIETALSQVAE